MALLLIVSLFSVSCVTSRSEFNSLRIQVQELKVENTKIKQDFAKRKLELDKSQKLLAQETVKQKALIQKQTVLIKILMVGVMDLYKQFQQFKRKMISRR